MRDILKRTKQIIKGKSLVTRDSFTIDSQIYDISISYKQVKRVTLKLDSESKLSITVPNRTTKRQIFNFLNERSSWIKKNIRKTDARKMYSLCDGGYLHFLGTRFPVMLVKSDKDSLTIDNDLAIFECDDFSEEHLKLLFDNYLKIRSKIVINPILERWIETTGLIINKVVYRKMKTRWGVCNITDSKLTFNTRLLMFSEDIITYVVVHELCHLYEPNHSQNFWNHVGDFLPTYKKTIQKMKLGGLVYE